MNNEIKTNSYIIRDSNYMSTKMLLIRIVFTSLSLEKRNDTFKIPCCPIFNKSITHFLALL